MAKEMTEQGKQSEAEGLNEMMSVIDGAGVTDGGSGSEVERPSPVVTLSLEEGSDKATIVVNASEETNGISSVKLLNQENTKSYSEGTKQVEERFEVYENGTYSVEVKSNIGKTVTQSIEVSCIQAEAVVKIGSTEQVELEIVES